MEILRFIIGKLIIWALAHPKIQQKIKAEVSKGIITAMEEADLPSHLGQKRPF